MTKAKPKLKPKKAKPKRAPKRQLHILLARPAGEAPSWWPDGRWVSLDEDGWSAGIDEGRAFDPEKADVREMIFNFFVERGGHVSFWLVPVDAARKIALGL